MGVISNVVKVTNELSYANIDNTVGVLEGEYQTSEVFIYNGNVYPIYQQQLWIPALPNAGELLVDYYIPDYPTDPRLPVWLHGVAREPGEIYRNFDAYGSTLQYAIRPDFVQIVTTDDKSTYSGFVTIKYVHQNDYTPIAKF